MMNKLKLTILVFTLLSGALLISCNSSAKKLENAEEKVQKANMDLEIANELYLEEMKKYKQETTTKTSANKKIINDFNERIAKEKKEVTAEYRKKMNELDQKNTDLKKKMDDYRLGGKEKWESFKAEFNHDMNELATAIKDLIINNEK